jgi:heme/copper-type cytochrome/quinol oxidase subunit 1
LVVIVIFTNVGAIAMLLKDRIAIQVSMTQMEEVIIWHQLVWVFGHPEVYILI